MADRAVLFDLDGTLLDTLADLADSMNRALEKRGLPTHPVDAYRHFVGDGVEILVRRAAARATAEDAALVADLVADMREEYRKRWNARSRPYPGVARMLDALTRRELPMAVLSNKPHEFTQMCVSEFLPDWAFEVVQGVTDGVPPKPDPAGAKAVADRLQVAPERVLYLGDTNTDMCTAVAAQMRPIGALWGFRDAEELTDAGAEVLLDRPEELVDLLEDDR